MEKLKGKVFVITGGRRVGQEVARALLLEGASIAMTSTSDEGIKGLQELTEKNPHQGFYMKADVTREEEVKEFVEEAAGFFGHIDGLIYMASIFPKRESKMPSEEEWRQMIEIHVFGAERFVRYLTPFMMVNASGGKIIIFSDGAAETRHPYRGFRHYLVSKAAAAELVRTLAVDLAPKILVNGVAPGPIQPPPEYSEKEAQEIADLTLLKRWGGPQEIAKAVLYLLEQGFMTGQVLVIDGGRYLFVK